MSLATCQDCGRIIDSDDDPECFREDEFGKDLILCVYCRERREDEDWQREEEWSADALL